MPYIHSATRESLDSTLEQLSSKFNSPGELNYVITRLCIQYARGNESYAIFNEIVGALECAKLEFYRRALAPYEDKKKEKNGDVYFYRKGE